MLNKIFLCLVTTAIVLVSHGQCPTCTPDETCVSADGFPAICPLELPPAVAGQYYEQVLTFYLPAQVNDPGTGVDATLEQITITSVSGLPFGMTYSINDPDNTYYPSQGENYGCATICGTPVLQGVYDMVIAVNVVAIAFGFEVTQSETFTYTLVVEPGEGGTSTFTYDNPAGCGNLNVYFESIIGGTPSQETIYSWDFGNGQASDQAVPGYINFDQPGDYTVSLTTIISNYILDVVSVTSLDDNWDGDIDDLVGSADPYFEVYDGANNLIYTSGILDNTTSGSWTGLGIVLTTPPYTITFWDDDLISALDNLGSVTLSLSEGSNSLSTGTGTNGSYTIVMDEVNNVTSEAVISVFPVPDATFSVSGNVLSCNDQSLSTYVWLLNDVQIPGENSPELLMEQDGWYSVVVSNTYGCTDTSEAYLFCPEIDPVYDLETDILSVDEGFESYVWYYNGLPVDGGTNYYIENPENGNYSVEITTTSGCEIESSVITINVSIEERGQTDLVLFPNPASLFLQVQIPADYIGSQWEIIDMTGKVVQTGKSASSQWTIPVESLPAGAYSLLLRRADAIVSRRFVKD